MNYPYGTSMVCVMVDEDGILTVSTSRWNHLYEAVDACYTENELAEIVGMPFGQAFPTA